LIAAVQSEQLTAAGVSIHPRREKLLCECTRQDIFIWQLTFTLETRRFTGCESNLKKQQLQFAQRLHPSP
jgi:hypothetical protein